MVGDADAAAAGRAWRLMRALVDEHSRHRELADALGFSLGDGRGRVLSQLLSGPQTQSALAELNHTNGPYISLIVDKLEGHHLVARQPCPDDRRRKLVALTARGREAMATVEEILYRPPAALHALGEDELGRLVRLLQRAVDADGA